VTDVDVELVAAATEARDRSYVPYSNFAMGAAVRCADGAIVPGALVENVSLGLAMCAERAALFATVARGLDPIALALVADRTSGELTFPCGACAQVALELGGPSLSVIAAEPGGATHAVQLADLLPRAPHRHTYAPGSGPGDEHG
jgi:homotetrameric cytidine deaminase